MKQNRICRQCNKNPVRQGAYKQYFLYCDECAEKLMNIEQKNS